MAHAIWIQFITDATCAYIKSCCLIKLIHNNLISDKVPARKKLLAKGLNFKLPVILIMKDFRTRTFSVEFSLGISFINVSH